MASRSFYKGFRDASYMHTRKLLEAEQVFVVERDHKITRLTAEEFRTELASGTKRGVRFCLTEREANEWAERRKSRARS
jgi:hypothetical protein